MDTALLEAHELQAVGAAVGAAGPSAAPSSSARGATLSAWAARLASMADAVSQVSDMLDQERGNVLREDKTVSLVLFRKAEDPSAAD
eukprot:7702204-Alexandrium_andersonii.AAC.1